MKIMKIALVAVLTSACSTAPSPVVRTKQADPIMRVAIDPENLPEDSYMRLEMALFRDGRFQIVDRGRGFRAALQEQELQHKENGNRFSARDKYALWARMFGVGGVIVAHQSCREFEGFSGLIYNKCHLNLSIIDASTGEIISMGEAKAETEGSQQNPGWGGAVDSLAENFPKTMINPADPHQTMKYSQTLMQYRKQAADADADLDAGRVPASHEMSE